MMGLWIVAVATLPLYYWYKAEQRKKCKHGFANYRYCEICGHREKAVSKIKVDQPEVQDIIPDKSEPIKDEAKV